MNPTTPRASSRAARSIALLAALALLAAAAALLALLLVFPSTQALAQAVDSPATGLPTISGTAQVDETLTANTLGIADADGLDNAVFGYQWVADNSDIAGATDSTYTLVADDEGKTLKVRVSFTDDADNEEMLTSAPTAEVASRPNTPATGQPTITGTAVVGETLTADTSGIADPDGLVNATFSYQWLRPKQLEDFTYTIVEIVDATGSTYTLTDADIGRVIANVQVRVSFNDDAGNYESLTSEAITSVRPAPAPVVSGRRL